VQFGGGAGAKFGSLQFGGESADGSLPAAPTESGESTDGASTDGASTDGASTNGASTNGASANGAVPAPRAETSEQPITVYYPAGAKNELSFKLNGDEYVIAPGQTMTLRRDRRWILQYERKPSGRRVQIELGNGRFEFFQTDAGWNLKPMPVAEELPAPDAANAPPPPDEADAPRTERRRRRRR